jgi:peptide/nickel transport system substrate-binding protein
MSADENVEWQLADLVDAISAEVDRAEDTLALKSYARKVSFAIKKIAMDLEVTMRRAPDGRLFFRSVTEPVNTSSLLKLDFAQVLESQLAGLRRPLEDTTTSAPLSTLPGITAEDIKALNAIAIYSVDDLLRYTRTASMLAEVSRKTLIAETRLRAWRGEPYVSELKPARGAPGSTVVIEGGNFGLVQPADTLVMFHGKEANILTWSNTRLTVEVPQDVAGVGVVFAVIGTRPTNVATWESTVMDLRVDDVSIADAVAGEPFSVEALLLNRGRDATPAFSVQWVVDTVAEPAQPHGVLQPGQRSSESTTRRQLTLDAGVHTVRFLADPEGALPLPERAGLHYSRTFEVRPVRSMTLGDFRALSSLDPLLAGPQGPGSVLGLLFRGLGRPGGPGEVVPDLAESWTPPTPVEVNGTQLFSVTVTLRSELRFQDGTPLTPEDVRFTFQTLRVVSSPWRTQALRIQDISVQGQQLVFLLEAPDALTPLLPVGIVPRAAYSVDPQGFGQRPVGSGPFRVVSFVGNRLELQAFRGYFRGAPRLDRLSVVMVEDLDQLGERVEQQEFQVAVMPYDAGWFQRLSDLGEWKLTPAPSAQPPLLHVQVLPLLERDATAHDITANAHLWYLPE